MKKRLKDFFNTHLAPFIYNPQGHSTDSFSNRAWTLGVAGFVFLSICFFFFALSFDDIHFLGAVTLFFIAWHFLYTFNIFNIYTFCSLFLVFLLLLLPPIVIFELIFIGFTGIWMTL